METWFSPAKLNLFLYITGRRADGYHDLQTLFQLLDYGDNLTFSAQASSAITLKSAFDPRQQEDNLIIKAATLLRQHAQQQQKSHLCAQGFDIQLEKCIPIGGGLGGGSSNAATTLLVLNRLWELDFSLPVLANIGVKLGADVPVFIYGQAAFAEGIGEELQPVTLPEKWFLILHPNIMVSTLSVFNDILLPRNTPKRDLAALLSQPFTNDCENVVRKRFPEVEQLISSLIEYAPCRLTGTGACVFAEFNDESKAQAALKSVLTELPADTQGFVAKGLSSSPLHRQLAERST
jgi:4-diphosphocytidyl-2-C-methyl-D-erythritol kinase